MFLNLFIGRTDHIHLLKYKNFCIIKVMTEDITLEINNHKIPCFIANPKDNNGKGIILIHEIWGLNENIKDIAQRFSNIGYTVLAPDLLSELPPENRITPDILLQMRDPKNREESQEKMKQILEPINSEQFKEIALLKEKECFQYLQNTKDIENIAVIGFCFGGTYCFALSMSEKNLKASIPFYGRFPSQNFDDIKNINCPTLAFYGEQDTELVSSIPPIKEKMSQYNKSFEYIIYPDCGHAFFNDQNHGLYNEKAAKDAWNKTLKFLEENL